MVVQQSTGLVWEACESQTKFIPEQNCLDKDFVLENREQSKAMLIAVGG